MTDAITGPLGTDELTVMAAILTALNAITGATFNGDVTVHLLDGTSNVVSVRWDADTAQHIVLLPNGS
jgi:hypothetical protein